MGNSDAWVFKISSTGVLDQSMLYETADADEADYVTAVQESGFQYYIVVGVVLGVTGSSSFILKLDASGDIIWKKNFGGGGGPTNTPTSVVPASSGQGYGVAGTRPQATDSRGWALKLNKDGSTAWFKYYGTPGRDTIAQLSRTVDGGYVAGGRTLQTGGNLNTWILKLDGSADIQWQKSYVPDFHRFHAASCRLRMEDMPRQVKPSSQARTSGPSRWIAAAGLAHAHPSYKRRADRD